MKIGILTFVLLISISGFSHLEKGSEFIVQTRKGSTVKMQVLRLNLTFTIPPAMFPKKTVLELRPSLFGYQFKSMAIQGVKAFGNTLTIDYNAGATFVYTDYVAFEAGMRDQKGDGALVISQTSNKGKALQTSLTLKDNEDMRYYFDESQSTYFTIHMDYVFEEL